jgi:hypothetical protein
MERHESQAKSFLSGGPSSPAEPRTKSSGKLESKWFRRYTVAKKMGSGTYCLSESQCEMFENS